MEPDFPVIKDIPLGYNGKYGKLLRQLENAPPGKAIVVRADTFSGCSPHAALRIKKRVKGVKLCVRNRCDGIYLWLEPVTPQHTYGRRHCKICAGKCLVPEPKEKKWNS